ncbi:hypothetical protein D9M73_107460 [compost metagenome]
MLERSPLPRGDARNGTDRAVHIDRSPPGAEHLDPLKNIDPASRKGVEIGKAVEPADEVLSHFRWIYRLCRGEIGNGTARRDRQERHFVLRRGDDVLCMVEKRPGIHRPDQQGGFVVDLLQVP